MGCAQSKIENEEAVTRCKERKQLMKDAVTARNAFAAAHSAYAMALKNTGAALSDYSHGEFLVSGGNHHHSSSAAAATIASSSSVPTAISPPLNPVSNSSASIASSSVVSGTGTIPQPITDTLPPPPPPPPLPLQRAATMPEMNGRSGVHSGNGLNGIEEDGTLDHDDDDDSDSELENHDRLIRKSRSNRGGGSIRNRKMIDEEEAVPPPPPATNSRPIPPPRQHQHQHQQEQPYFDYLFANVDHTPGTTLEDNAPPPLPPTTQQQSLPQVAKPESLPHSEEDDDDEEEEEEEDEEEEETVRQPVEEKPKRVAEEVVENVTNLRGMKKSKGIALAGGRLPVTKTNLSNVFNELDEDFLKASESAHEVSKMLEATRLHYHSNFADNRGKILIR